METVKLGKSGIIVNKIGFGALPLQRANEEIATELLQKAYNNGVNFFDTARAYTNSEERIGKALSDVRENIIIASKTQAENTEEFWNDLETSLKNLQTDYIDLYQFHNPPFCPKPGDESGIYDAMLEAREQGLIKHIGISAHKFTLARKEIKSELFETMQFPFSYLTEEKELNLVKLCKKNNIGFIAMKAMGGGLIKNSKVSYAFMEQFNNVLPIWGVQKINELDEFLNYGKTNPRLDEKALKIIKNDKKELQGDFCRGCGYCAPCSEGIKINFCARMSLWIRRFPPEPCLTEEMQTMMKKIEDCTECRECVKRCPYDLDIPKLLKENYEDYKNILSGKTKV